MFCNKVFLILIVTIMFVGGSLRSVTASEKIYIGAAKCKLCHATQYQAWTSTTMAKAFELLLPEKRSAAKEKAGFDHLKDYTTDNNCVSCHTTGYGQPGGFVSIAKTPELTGVQCEVCHGPGGKSEKHMYSKFKPEDAYKYGLLKVTEATCLQCHNEKNPFVKSFDFKNRIKDGVHKHFKKKHNHAKQGNHDKDQHIKHKH